MPTTVLHPSRYLLAVLAAALLTLLAAELSPARADSLFVPRDYPTIQSAVDAAGPGDVVEVAEGVYEENLVLKPGVRLEGGWKSDYSARNWDSWPSVIDGGQKGSVVVGAHRATLDGFTLRNGTATRGGGLLVDRAAMTIKNNTIEDNTASYQGGGIYLGVTPRAPPYTDIENNVIVRNKAWGQDTGFGGGIYLYHCQPGVRIKNNTIGGPQGDGNAAYAGGGGIGTESTPIFLIEGNTISHNSSDRFHGGGVSILEGTPNATLCGNTINYNSLVAGNLGGGIYSVGGTRICRNTIAHNTIHYHLGSGGGLAIQHTKGTAPRVENNFINNNYAQAGGGGVHVDIGQDVILMNNSIANNGASAAGNGIGVQVDADATCILQNNILWNNGDVVLQEVGRACWLSHNDIEDGDAEGEEGNISAPPHFRSFDDLHLTKTSAAIDAGRKTAAPEIDFDGDSRPAKVDIGADEYVHEDGTLPCPFKTVASSSFLARHTGEIREFRDIYLLASPPGRAATALYYEKGPRLSRYLLAHPKALPVARWLLAPPVLLIAFRQEIGLLLLGLALIAGWRLARGA